MRTFWETASQPPAMYSKATIVYVSRPRKDGKHLLTFCYYARKIRKLCTPEQVETFRQNSEYQLRSAA